jgi:cytochrome P450
VVLHRNADWNLSSLFRPDILANPYPFYAELRSQDPVHWDRSRNAWVLTRYEDVASVPSDPRFVSELWAQDTSWIPDSQRADLGPAFLSMRKELIFSDPPDHTPMRTLFGRVLSGRINEDLRRRVEHIAHGLLDAVQPRGGMDAIADFACPLPFLVMADLMGIPPEDRVRLRDWSEAHGQLITMRWDKLLPALHGFRRVREYFRNLAAERRDHPGPDLISALLVAKDRNDALPHEDVLANMAFILMAAHMNTTNLIGNGLLALLRHPEERRALQERPALLTSAVEELLRFESPVQMITRQAKENLTLGGMTIAKGQVVFLLLGAANRDPARFADPDRLDLARPDNRHLAFAPGLHYCLGAALGRLEGQVAFATLLQRFPALRLSDTPLDWHRNLLIRGVKALPLIF